MRTPALRPHLPNSRKQVPTTRSLRQSRNCGQKGDPQGRRAGRVLLNRLPIQRPFRPRVGLNRAQTLLETPPWPQRRLNVVRVRASTSMNPPGSFQHRSALLRATRPSTFRNCQAPPLCAKPSQRTPAPRLRVFSLRLARQYRPRKLLSDQQRPRQSLRVRPRVSVSTPRSRSAHQRRLLVKRQGAALRLPMTRRAPRCISARSRSRLFRPRHPSAQRRPRPSPNPGLPAATPCCRPGRRNALKWRLLQLAYWTCRW
jgi:hypothetical protein